MSNIHSRDAWRCAHSGENVGRRKFLPSTVHSTSDEWLVCPNDIVLDKVPNLTACHSSVFRLYSHNELLVLFILHPTLRCFHS